MAAKKSSKASKQAGAIAQLEADHSKVKKMFKQFEKLHDAGSDEEAGDLAQTICKELTVHATVEEEIFYPAVRDAIDEDDLMNEAEIEHASAKDLIAQIESMDPSDDKFAATVTVLGEYINHHVEEEEGEMFPKARRAKIDVVALGIQMEERKQVLKGQLGMSADDVKSARSRSRPKSSLDTSARR